MKLVFNTYKLLSYLLILFLFPMGIQAEEKTPNVDSTKLVIKYKDETNTERLTEFQQTEVLETAKIIEVPTKDVTSLKKELSLNPSVEYVEEEVAYSFMGNVNDPSFDSYQKVDFDYMQVPQAWDLFSLKEKAIVAVIDSGITLDHPDLQDNIVKPYNVLNPSQYPVDNLGHGTHVSGIVGAKTNNNLGVASISRGVKIMPIKVGDQGTLSSVDLAKGIEVAADNGAKIINISVGGPYSKVVEDACNYAIEKGVLIIAAAGNQDRDEKVYPAAFNQVIGVAASDSQQESIASYSNYGSWVSVAAPGTNIYSTYVNKSYSLMSGTSMATPMVSSLAALLKSHAPTLTNNQIRWIIESSSKSYNDSKQVSNGVINAYESIKLYDNYSRIYGNTSVETSNEIASTGWTEVVPHNLAPQETSLNKTIYTGEASYAIIASNKSFPDSLAASALSYKLDAPILLTYPNSISENTLTKLHELGVTHTIILGGTEAISGAIDNNLKKNNIIPIRISGLDRYRTAIAINDYIAKTSGTVIVANGKNYPDALSVASYSGQLQHPIVFVEKDKIPKATMDFIKKYKFNRAIIVGGSSVVSKKVEDMLPSPIRLAGNDRYETNTNVLSYFEGDKSQDGYLFAIGTNFPDALSGGALSAKLGHPLLLVKKDALPYVTKEYLLKTSSENIAMGVLGGPAAVATKTIWDIDRIIFKTFYEDILYSRSTSNDLEYTSVVSEDKKEISEQ